MSLLGSFELLEECQCQAWASPNLRSVFASSKELMSPSTANSIRERCRIQNYHTMLHLAGFFLEVVFDVLHSDTLEILESEEPVDLDISLIQVLRWNHGMNRSLHQPFSAGEAGMGLSADIAAPQFSASTRNGEIGAAHIDMLVYHFSFCHQYVTNLQTPPGSMPLGQATL